MYAALTCISGAGVHADNEGQGRGHDGNVDGVVGRVAVGQSQATPPVIRRFHTYGCMDVSSKYTVGSIHTVTFWFHTYGYMLVPYIRLHVGFIHTVICWFHTYGNMLVPYMRLYVGSSTTFINLFHINTGRWWFLCGNGIL
mgnify:CR=1 FL=1